MCPPFASAIVIAGMHRSGTSLAASLVASAGVHIGDRLMGPERGNVRGHFEDLDFYELHQQALAANGLGGEGFTCAPSIPLSPAVHDAFDAIVARRRARGRPWGWKDPRTTLFLDAWLEKLPEARFLLLFRRPWEVVDSLFRRGDAAFTMNPRLAVDVWVAYNRRIREFLLAHRERCLLVEAKRVAHDPAGLIAAVGRLMGMELSPPEDHYDPALLVEDDSFDRKELVRRMRPEAIDLYEALIELAGGDAAAPRPTPAQDDDLIDAATMQWVRTARMERFARHRDAELAATSHQLAATSQQLTATMAERDDLAQRLACRTADFTAERDASLSRLEAAGREIAALRNKLVGARRGKTVRERLSIESRRFVRRASGLRGVLG